MSAHLRHLWHRQAAVHLRSLLASWQPTGRAGRLQRRVVARLDDTIRALPKPVPVHVPRHATMPTIYRRAV